MSQLNEHLAGSQEELLHDGTSRSGAGEEKYPCFPAKVPQDVFIIKPKTSTHDVIAAASNPAA